MTKNLTCVIPHLFVAVLVLSPVDLLAAGPSCGGLFGAGVASTEPAPRVSAERKVAILDQRLDELSRGDSKETESLLTKLLKPIAKPGESQRRSSFQGAGSIGFFETGSTKPTVVKVLDLEVTDLVENRSSSFKREVTWTNGPAFPYGVKSLASSALLAIRGSFLAESEGGPKVTRVGTWTHPETKKVYLAVELERLFPDQKSVNVKDLAKTNRDFSRLAEPAMETALADKMAKSFAQALRKNILPMDAQFLITSDGRMRWIDGDQWIQVRSEKSNFNWNRFSSFVIMDFVALFDKRPRMGNKVFAALVREIRLLPPAQRTSILTGLRENLDHLVWVAPPNGGPDRIQKPFSEILDLMGITSETLN